MDLKVHNWLVRVNDGGREASKQFVDTTGV